MTDWTTSKPASFIFIAHVEFWGNCFIKLRIKGYFEANIIQSWIVSLWAVLCWWNVTSEAMNVWNMTMAYNYRWSITWVLCLLLFNKTLVNGKMPPLTQSAVFPLTCFGGSWRALEISAVRDICNVAQFQDSVVFTVTVWCVWPSTMVILLPAGLHIQVSAELQHAWLALKTRVKTTKSTSSGVL